MLRRITKLAGKCRSCGEAVELQAEALPLLSNPVFPLGMTFGVLVAWLLHEIIPVLFRMLS